MRLRPTIRLPSQTYKTARIARAKVCVFTSLWSYKTIHEKEKTNVALTQVPTAAVNIQLRDRDNNLSSVSFYYPSANTVANIQAEVETTLIPAVQALSDAVVSSWAIMFQAVDLDIDPTVDAPETSDVERKAVFVFSNGAFSTTKYEVPSVKNSLVVDGSNVLDVTDPAVTGFIAAIQTAGVDGLKPSAIGNAAISKLKGTPHKIHRRSTKG